METLQLVLRTSSFEGWANERSVKDVSLYVLLFLEISKLESQLGGLMWRDRSGSGFEDDDDEDGSKKIPSKGIFFSLTRFCCKGFLLPCFLYSKR